MNGMNKYYCLILSPPNLRNKIRHILLQRRGPFQSRKVSSLKKKIVSDMIRCDQYFSKYSPQYAVDKTPYSPS